MSQIEEIELVVSKVCTELGVKPMYKISGPNDDNKMNFSISFTDKSI